MAVTNAVLECCMSGCAVCVYDLYDESREVYEKAVSSLREALVRAKIPEAEWPAQIRSESPKDAGLSAFQALEQALQAKREASESASQSAP